MEKTLVRDERGCEGCPLREDGNKTFVPDELVEGAPVLVYGQNPGQEEAAIGRPFVGKTGQTMDKLYFPVAGLERGVNVSIGNAIRCRWQNSNELPPLTSPVFREAVNHCTQSHRRIPNGTRLVVVQGAYALYAMTGHGYKKNDTVTAWRGWLLPAREGVGGVPGRGRVPCHSSVHADGDLLGGLVQGVEEGSDASRVVGPDGADSGDDPGSTVYHPGPGDLPVLVTLHLAALFRQPEMLIPTRMDWQKVRRVLAGTWPEHPPQILTEPDVRMFHPEAAWDTEYVPSSQRLLRFSVATKEGRVYVVENQKGLRGRLEGLYKQPHPLKMVHPKGLCLVLREHGWERRAGETPWVGIKLRVFFQNANADLPYLAHLLPERSVIVGEDLMLAHAVLWGGAPHDLDYLTSIYGPLNRHKHLMHSNPVLYSGLDAYTQLKCWEALERELENDPQSEHVYRTYVLPLLPIIQRAEQRGILIDHAEVQKAITYLEQEVREATELAHAAAGFPLNLGSSKQVGAQLFEVEGVKPPKRGRGR